MQAIAERPGERGGERVVAALDAIERARRGRVGRSELIDERNQRELVRIGQKESTQAGRGRAQFRVGALDWLGAARAEPIASHQVIWEQDAYARGGYAFFDPAFDPSLRPWLAQSCGRLLFAGEHTSLKWQGYMNGAVESGRRAAAEVVSTHRMGERTIG